MFNGGGLSEHTEAASLLGELMKKVEIILIELTKQEAAELHNGTQVLVYNPMMDTYRLDRMSNSHLARSRFAAEYLKYFVFSENDLNIN